MTASKLYYDPAKPTAFSTFNKLTAAAAAVKTSTTTKLNKKNLRAWLEKQDPYTLQPHYPETFRAQPLFGK